jgi:hypothetical protein
MDYTEGIKSPPRFRRWAAVSAIAGALQRRVSIRIESQYQFPNLYTLLVGPPGVGKGNAVKPMQRMLRKINTIHLSPRGLSKRALYTVLEEAKDVDLDDNLKPVTHSSVTAVIEEFGVFLPPKDIDFMDALSDVYDNPESFYYRTQHSGQNDIHFPCFNFIAASTPRGVKERFTDDIFEQGLPARMTMIYADDIIKVPLFKERPKLDELEDALIHDLEAITHLKGQFVWTQEATDILLPWHDQGMKPAPMDPRFSHYCARRLAHLTKLCMVISAARSDELRITAEDFKDAKSMLLEAENMMPGAIKAIGANPLKDQIQAVYLYACSAYARTGKPVPEFTLLRFMEREVPIQYIDVILTHLCNSAKFRYSGESPTRMFYPQLGEKHGQFGSENPTESAKGTGVDGGEE